jgi:hypothetical protein
LISDSSSCGPGAENYHPHVFELELANVKGCRNGSQGDATCSLDVIIEARDFRAIAVEDAASCRALTWFDYKERMKTKDRGEKRTIWQAEILEVDIRFGVQLSSRLNEGVYKIIVFFASDTRLLKAEIEFIF